MKTAAMILWQIPVIPVWSPDVAALRGLSSPGGLFCVWARIFHRRGTETQRDRGVLQIAISFPFLCLCGSVVGNLCQLGWS